MSKYYSKRNIDFLLYEVFDAAALTTLAYYKHQDKETFDLVLFAIDQLAEKHLYPYLTEMDRKAPYLENGHVKVHPQMRRLMKEYGDGGWISADASIAHGGQQLPFMITSCFQFITGAANYSASVYPFLSSGSARLITHFGSEELKEKFVQKMYDGVWQGTMAMTEPDAGSSLGDISTSAMPIDGTEGAYKIKGQKVFISAGDHDGVDNVVHLMLARVKGAPEGSKGISLFVVPQQRISDDGSLEFNDVITSGLFHKMGYKGCPIVQLSMGESDDCHGYLLGKGNYGLRYMFQMMNEARIAVGLSAVSIASAAYYASLAYAHERPQGRKLSGEKTKHQVPIIEHADVKRMLLFQKSITEGAHALLMQCALYADYVKAGTDKQREYYGALLNLLTPAAKSYPSEMGILTTSAAVQVLGGAGYCDDFPIEQYYREMRIHTIHEGTTAIHGLDLLGRKVMGDQGAVLKILIGEMLVLIKSIQENNQIYTHAKAMNDLIGEVQAVTLHLGKIAAKNGKEALLSDATLYLEMFGIFVVAWQWLKQAAVASEKLAEGQPKEEIDFYQGKIFAMKYFFEYEVPKTRGLIERLMSDDRLTVDVAKEFIN